MSKHVEEVDTLERVLKVLKALVLKMTRFLLQRMKATMPNTTNSSATGVITASSHRLPGGVFTTATHTYAHAPGQHTHTNTRMQKEITFI